MQQSYMVFNTQQTINTHRIPYHTKKTSSQYTINLAKTSDMKYRMYYTPLIIAYIAILPFLIRFNQWFVQ